MGELEVYKNRTNRVTVRLGIDVSGDTITSEIRTATGELIAEWTVTFDSDGTDGVLILTLLYSELTSVEYSEGLMDFKRVSGGHPLPVIKEPIEVKFVDSVTV